MDYYEELFQQIIDDNDSGMIYINKQNEFSYINRKAKEILGILQDDNNFHPAGTISPGDIVVIADNSLGFDDGNLDAADLKLINIDDKNISKNDTFIAIGVYKGNKKYSEYKYLPSNKLTTSLSLDVIYYGHRINVRINPVGKIVSIKVNNIEYVLHYRNGIGHMVIIDKDSGNIKFFQTRGYSIRKESVKEVLYGKPFIAKGIDRTELNIIGQKVDFLIEGSELIEKIKAILRGDVKSVSNEILHMNKIISLCSLRPIIINGNVDGVLLKIIDTSEIEQQYRIRNAILENIEKAYDNDDISPETVTKGFFENIIGRSIQMQRVKYLAYKASQIGSNVIITGESGTGKSMIAYEIHRLYKPEDPFVEVNCGSIPSNLFESELFGYVGGAFTGALLSGKNGFFEDAKTGTIFLDEIGEIPLEMQVKLLQVIQSKRFYKLGSSKPLKTDVRIIAATNRNLQEEIQKGTFREDLFYRLNVFSIHIPPLRERKSDIHLFVKKFAEKTCREFKLGNKQFSGAAINKLINYSWPGNIRELENVIERAIALSETDIIFPEYIDIYTKDKPSTFKEQVEEAEKNALINTLQLYQDDKNLAMQSLEMSKSTFYEKLKKYNL